MVKRGILILAVCIYCASCATYEIGGIFGASSSVKERFENSTTLPDKDCYPESMVNNSDSYRFLVATDLHIRDNHWDKIGEFTSLAASDGSLLTMLLGDYMYAAGGSLQRLSDSIAIHNSLRVFPAIGNHDVYKDGYQESYRPVFGATTYSFNVETPTVKDLFIVLDSANGTLGKEQFGWLESLLADERGASRHCFIFTHANFFSPADYVDVISTYPVEEMMKLLDMFSRYKVTAVFTGHSHERDITTLKGTKYITVGSWCDYNEYCTVECGADGSVNYSFRKAE